MFLFVSCLFSAICIEGHVENKLDQPQESAQLLCIRLCRIDLMSENPHKSLAPCPSHPIPTSIGHPWRQLAPWLLPFWLAVTLGCLLGPIGGQWLLNRLPQSEPDPARRSSQSALAASRLLMAPQVAPSDLKTLLSLWAGSGGLTANDCLFGAVLAKQAGHPAASRIWLALEALAHVNRARAKALLAGTGVALPQLDRARQAGSDWLETQPLGQRLTGALATPEPGRM